MIKEKERKKEENKEVKRKNGKAIKVERKEE